ncbi:sensor histidine kinase [Planobispora longispora]|uniref:histidine kinase n=1 Tax=Planobispora longispora TaxID=28887 RepID=A0A8J3W9F4_9ACTN|nr:sensor histidine kinase [Planobispora longispora]GIH80945.1 two-component sensor histidine kinase [Planobispora longispora]
MRVPPTVSARPVVSARERIVRLRGVPPVVVDAVIAGAVAAATLWSGLRWAGGGPWVAVLALGASVPLLWRRKAPVPTASAVCAATTGLALAHALPPLPYGALVAVYTVAAFSARRERLLGGAAGAVLLAMSLAVPGESPDSFGYVGMAFVAACALGTGARARRAEIAALEERTRRLEEERTAIAAQERMRIARDMHDVLTHSVGVMVVQADAGSLAVRADPDRAEAALEAIARTGREAVGQLRRVLGALRSGDGAGLAPPPGLGEVERLVGQVRETGLEVAVEVLGEAGPVPADVGMAAYRLVQESLTNTLRHAGATAVRVRLSWSPDALRIEVTDDGRGPAPGGNAAGHGLIGMRERVEACGGTLRTGPGRGGPEQGERAGGGFTVTATLPLGTSQAESPPVEFPPVEAPQAESPPVGMPRGEYPAVGRERSAAVTTPPIEQERSADGARTRRR